MWNLSHGQSVIHHVLSLQHCSSFATGHTWVSLHLDCRILESWAFHVHWEQHSTGHSVHAQWTFFCLCWLPRERPLMPFLFFSYLLAHQSTELWLQHLLHGFTMACLYVISVLSLWPSRETRWFSCSPWYFQCLVDINIVSTPLILVKGKVAA